MENTWEQDEIAIVGIYWESNGSLHIYEKSRQDECMELEIKHVTYTFQPEYLVRTAIT